MGALMELERKGKFCDMVDGTTPLPPVSQLLGWKLLEMDPEKGRIRAQFEAKREFLSGVGNVQGGILTAMLDDVMGSALVCTLPPGHLLPVVELKTSFMRPAKLGPIFATGRVVFKAKSIAFVEGTLRDEAGKLIATASATMRIISPQPEKESS
ncbi:MAG: PaaI family thioesterase [Candidatus Hydrogenedentes bacterium]|nr:PaaI family thioesterase [Candidatus Hydrogenedentota bacterium]